MIYRKDSCIGITLFRWGRRKLELWFVLASYACVEHTHKDSDGEFFVLFGKDRFIWRKFQDYYKIGKSTYSRETQQMYNITERPYWKWYSVRADVPHGFGRGATHDIPLLGNLSPRLKSYIPGLRLSPNYSSMTNWIKWTCGDVEGYPNTPQPTNLPSDTIVFHMKDGSKIEMVFKDHELISTKKN